MVFEGSTGGTVNTFFNGSIIHFLFFPPYFLVPLFLCHFVAFSFLCLPFSLVFLLFCLNVL